MPVNTGRGGGEKRQDRSLNRGGLRGSPESLDSRLTSHHPLPDPRNWLGPWGSGMGDSLPQPLCTHLGSAQGCMQRHHSQRQVGQGHAPLTPWLGCHGASGGSDFEETLQKVKKERTSRRPGALRAALEDSVSRAPFLHVGRSSPERFWSSEATGHHWEEKPILAGKRKKKTEGGLDWAGVSPGTRMGAPGLGESRRGDRRPTAYPVLGETASPGPSPGGGSEPAQAHLRGPNATAGGRPEPAHRATAPRPPRLPRLASVGPARTNERSGG